MRSKPVRLAAVLGGLGIAALLVLAARARYRGGADVARAEPVATGRISVGEVEAELAAREALAQAEGPSAGGPDTAAPLPRPAGAPAAGSLTLGARLLDERARPLSGGELVQWLVDESGLPRPGRSAAADPNGVVWLVLPREELPAQGSLTLEARGPGRARERVSVARRSFEGTPLVSLGELLLGPGGSVSGRVLDAEGRPVAGALVGLALDGQRLSGAAPVALTDEEGRFTLEGVAPGRLALMALQQRGGGPPIPSARAEGVSVLAGQETRVDELVLVPAPPFGAAGDGAR
jgi:hypothetical protein